MDLTKQELNNLAEILREGNCINVNCNHCPLSINKECGLSFNGNFLVTRIKIVRKFLHDNPDIYKQIFEELL